MTGGLRKWSQHLDDDSKQSALRHAGEHMASGMLNAREDIRQKLIDEGWFGRQTGSNQMSSSGPDKEASILTENEQQEENGFNGTVWSQEGYTTDFHENPDWDNVRDVAQNQAEPTQAQSHELYGHDEQEPEL